MGDHLFLDTYSKGTVLGGVVQAWSLCTEMTFYLMIPAWAWLVRRAAQKATSVRTRALTHLAGTVALRLAAVASRVAIDAWFSGQRGLAFDWLPTNLDLFASGMALATVSVWAFHEPALRGRLDRVATPVAPWWLAAAALFTWTPTAVGPADFVTGYSGWFWHRRQILLGVLTVLLMMPAVFGRQATGWARRLRQVRPLAWVGTVSYGLYLWHFDWMKRSIAGIDGFGAPLWPGWRHTPPGNSSFVWLLAVGLGVGLVFVAASWYLLEQPLQRYKDLVSRRRAGALGTPSAQQ